MRFCPSLSNLLQCGFSLISAMCSLQPLGFLEEILPYVALDCMYPWEEMSSGFSYINILNWNHGIFLIKSTKLKHILGKIKTKYVINQGMALDFWPM